jgi:hypothetical protein
MKQFHISDVLSVTTGRLVSTRRIGGVYDVLNFLTGDELYTHQLPRASDECKPWLRTQFPALFPEAPGMQKRLDHLSEQCEKANGDRDKLSAVCNAWWRDIQEANGLPEMLTLYEMGAEMHTHIDPIEEAQAMMGDDRVIVVDPTA